MMSLIVEHNGKQWEVDCEGYRLDCNVTPDEDWYDYVRIKAGIPELTPAHREILELYQQYYKEHGIGPHIRVIKYDWKKSIRKVYEIFPGGSKTISIMAGFPMPRGHVGMDCCR